MAKKKKNMFQEKEPTVFVFGSMLSTIHLVLPFVKILSKIGTVALQTEDKSFLVLSPAYEKTFTIKNLSVSVKDEPLIYEDSKNLLDTDSRYNVLVVEEHVPDVNADLYFFSHPVNFFKQQIPPERRHTPMFTVCELTQHPPELRKHVSENLFINEQHLLLKPYPFFAKQLYQYTDLKNFDMLMPEPVILVLHKIFNTFTKYSVSDLKKVFKEEKFNADVNK